MPAVDPAVFGRRAIVLALGPAAAAAIEAVRRRWDPVMARRITPHVTLVHDVVDLDGAAARLTEAAAAVAPFRVELTDVGRWRVAAGVYVGVADLDGGIAALRSHLADLESPTWRRGSFRPHVTLVHPKYVTAEDAADAWAALAGADLHTVVDVDGVTLVELGIDGWSAVGQHRLHGPTV